MDNLLTVVLEAHNPEWNHHRRYEVTVGRDLFGDWTVALRFGRVGGVGQEVRHTSSDPQRLRKVIHDSLRRRLSAPKRIACPYRLRGLSAAQVIDVAFWLPADTLRCFLGGRMDPPFA